MQKKLSILVLALAGLLSGCNEEDVKGLRLSQLEVCVRLVNTRQVPGFNNLTGRVVIMNDAIKKPQDIQVQAGVEVMEDGTGCGGAFYVDDVLHPDLEIKQIIGVKQINMVELGMSGAIEKYDEEKRQVHILFDGENLVPYPGQFKDGYELQEENPEAQPNARMMFDSPREAKPLLLENIFERQQRENSKSVAI